VGPCRGSDCSLTGLHFQVMPILIRKMHEFCVEADVTMDEWMATCNFLVGAGQASNEARNEVVLASDVLGIESLVGQSAVQTGSPRPRR
jgi:hypothetical protein